MSAIEPAMRDKTWRRQAPTFVMVGLFGFVVDSGVTYALVRGARLDPLIARLPAFAVATVLNFLLNRSLTFANSRAPLLQAFVRYVTVCAAGLVINWCAFTMAFEAALRFGAPTSPETLPFYIAIGAGAAMFATFFGFKLFAFRA